METLSEIRKRRVALGIPLGELAKAIGRSDATLSRIERGQIRPSYELVQSILAYLEKQEGLTAPRLTVAELMNRSLVTVESSATLTTAAQKMEGGAFSQLPVVDDGRVVGSLSESALLRARKLAEAARSSAPTAAAMTGLIAEETMAVAEQSARRVLAACGEGDMLNTQLAILRRLARYTPAAQVALSHAVAQQAIQMEKYPI